LGIAGETVPIPIIPPDDGFQVPSIVIPPFPAFSFPNFDASMDYLRLYVLNPTASGSPTATFEWSNTNYAIRGASTSWEIADPKVIHVLKDGLYLISYHGTSYVTFTFGMGWQDVRFQLGLTGLPTFLPAIINSETNEDPHVGELPKYFNFNQNFMGVLTAGTDITATILTDKKSSGVNLYFTLTFQILRLSS
jgi:hypothetical protein